MIWALALLAWCEEPPDFQQRVDAIGQFRRERLWLTDMRWSGQGAGRPELTETMAWQGDQRLAVSDLAGLLGDTELAEQTRRRVRNGRRWSVTFMTLGLVSGATGFAAQSLLEPDTQSPFGGTALSITAATLSLTALATGTVLGSHARERRFNPLLTAPKAYWVEGIGRYNEALGQQLGLMPEDVMLVR